MNLHMQMIKTLAITFLLSLIYGAIVLKPGGTTPFEAGFTVGFAFGQAVKLLSLFGLLLIASRSIKRIHREII